MLLFAAAVVFLATYSFSANSCSVTIDTDPPDKYVYATSPSETIKLNVENVGCGDYTFTQTKAGGAPTISSETIQSNSLSPGTYTYTAIARAQSGEDALGDNIASVSIVVTEKKKTTIPEIPALAGMIIVGLAVVFITGFSSRGAGQGTDKPST